MNRPLSEGAPADETAAPIALDWLAYGIDSLDAVLVFHVGDAHLHATWVRPDSGLEPRDIVGSLQDLYRVCQFASRRLAGHGFHGTPLHRVAPLSPAITVEIPHRVALLRRVRSYAVVCIVEDAMPLGMARLITGRIVAALEPELPLLPGESTTEAFGVIHVQARTPYDRGAEDVMEHGPNTLSFGANRVHRSRPPSRAALSELDRTRRLLAYLESHAPEPHVARLRLALRAGLTLVALDHPEALGPEAIVLIETAVEDILGMDRTELRRIA